MLNKTIKSVLWTAALVLVMSMAASSQEVIMPDFPLGVAGSIESGFFEPYKAQLQAVADTLRAYPKARAIILGGADGEQFRDNHDALNPGLALGRALLLRNILVNDLKVDSAQIVILAEDSRIFGPEHRFASVRVDRALSDIDNRLTMLENRPPVERIVTEIHDAPRDSIIRTEVVENLGLQFGVGLTSSPYGILPAGSFSVNWKRRFHLEAIVGHSFWNNDYNFNGTILKSKRRVIGGHFIVYPDPDIPVGIVGGWIRTEEIAQRFYEYVGLSEGLVLGLRAEPLDFLQITGTYNPSKHRVAGIATSDLKEGQFMLTVMAFKAFGGGK